MEYELGYWKHGGVDEHDLHLATYMRSFPVQQLDYSRESILDVGSGAISVFENIAPEKADIMPFDVLAEEFNRLAPDKKFMIHSHVPEGKVFSLITLFNMLDHVDDPGDLLSYLQKLLRGDGRLWIAVHLYRPHGIQGHPQKFTCQSIVSLVSLHFSIESFGLIREGVPIPYMWCGILCSKEKSGRCPARVVFENYFTYLRLQSIRIGVKGLKILGMRSLLPKRWRF